MLFIRRRFTLSIHEIQYKMVLEKLNELEMQPIKTSYYRTEVYGHLVEKVFMDFEAPEDKLEKLIDYLQNDFKGIASITY